LALVEGCKHRLEITVPVEEVEKETQRVVASLQEKVRLPGFRPGKVPASMIRSRFRSEIRQEVLEALIPRHLRAEIERQDLPLVGTPEITNVKYEHGEPLRFQAEFEVSPEVELGDYRNITVTYREPEVADADVDQRLEQIREEKAEYVDIDPRPVADGDYAVVALQSIGGLPGPPIDQKELMLRVGDEETLSDFSDNLRGMEPGQEKDFDVTYPEDYGQQRLAGKTIRFHARLNAIRRKELPEIDDEFAKDLGDYQNLEELRQAVRQNLRAEKEFLAQQEAKNELIEHLVDMHDFPVPEAFVEHQVESMIEQRMREVAAQGVDPRSPRFDWEKIKESLRERATRDIKASLLLEKIGEREAIEVTRDEVDQQILRIARQRREPVAAVRAELEKEGEIGRIASRIRTEKTLNFLFEQARKVAPKAG